MVIIVRIIIALTMLIMVAACGTFSKPSMRYHLADEKKDASLKEGEMLFKLRSTNITVLPRSAVAASDKNSLDTVEPADICKPDPPKPKEEKQVGNAAGAALSTPPAVKPAVSANEKKSAEVQADCLVKVTVKSTAISDGDYYIAIPGNWFPWVRTGLAATTVDGDDSIIKTVAVSFNDQTKQAIARAGTGAVAGFGIAGPYGAIVGAIGGLVISLPDRGKVWAEVPLEKVSFTNLICKSDQVRGENVNKPANIALTLPVTIDLRDALKENEGKEDGCWHLLPDNPFAKRNGNAKDINKGNGWLYRVTLGDKPFGAQSPSAYFAKANNGWEPRHDFPFTACQDAKIHLVWWQTIQDAMPIKDSDLKDLRFKYHSFPIKVANPDLIQVVPLPRAGSITLGAVCGANVKYDTYSGPTIGDDFDAAVTARLRI
jgi:hypothetical protein